MPAARMAGADTQWGRVHLRAAAVVGCTALLAGCTAALPAENLGTLSYVLDQEPSVPVVTTFHTGERIDALATTMRDLQASGIAQRVDGVDRATQVVVTVYYDACGKEQPELVLTGSTLKVRYGVELNRNCVRAMDTLTVFAVPRSRLPDPTVLDVCGRQVTLSGDTVTGDPIGLC